MKRTVKQWWEGGLTQDSPVEEERKQLPRGKGDWAGFDHVYHNISEACEKMGLSRDCRMSDLHVTSMAILGCGDEETMKYQQMILRDRGWM